MEEQYPPRQYPQVPSNFTPERKPYVVQKRIYVEKKPSTREKSPLFFIGFFVLFLAILGGGIFFWWNNKKSSLSTPSPSLPTIPPLPAEISNSKSLLNLSEKGEAFFVITENEKRPKILRLALDPFKGERGDIQKIFILAEDEIEIKEVKAVVRDESGEREISLNLMMGDEKKGFWQGSWQIIEVKNKNYEITFWVENEKNEKNSAIISWKGVEEGAIFFPNLFQKFFTLFWGEKVKAQQETPSLSSCQFLGGVQKGDCFLKQSVVLGPGIVGIDGGNLTIEENTYLQLLSQTTFVINEDKNIYAKGNLLLSENDSAIVKGCLCVLDADNDGCWVQEPKKLEGGDCQKDVCSLKFGEGWKRVAYLRHLPFYPDSDDSKFASSPACLATTPLTPSPNTLSVSLSAIPSSGKAPLNYVNLKAVVSGTAKGEIKYQFDCTNDGTIEIEKIINETSYTAFDICNYPAEGTYEAKVKVTREGIVAEATTYIVVEAPPSIETPPLNVSLKAIPNIGVAPLKNVDLKAIVSGSAEGPIYYQFDCNNDGEWEKEEISSETTYTAIDLCDYSSVGSYKAKVRVERGGYTATAITQITATSQAPPVSMKENCCNGIDDDSDGKKDGYDPDCQKDINLSAGSNNVCWWTEWKPYGNNRDYYSGWFNCPQGYLINSVNITQNTEEKYDFFYIYDGENQLRYKESGDLGTKEISFTSFNTPKIRFRFTSDKDTAKDGVKVNVITCSKKEFPLPTYRLEVSKMGNGSGRVFSSPAGIDCGFTCQSLFNAATPVTLRAEPDPNSQFSGWYGCDLITENKECVVIADSDKVVIAVFNI